MLEKAILQFYSHHLLEKAEMEIIRNKFEEFDINGDGFISYKELKSILHYHGFKSSAKDIFRQLDVDKNRVISYNEYIQALVDRRKLDLENNIRKCFDAIDTNRNRRISLHEMERIALVSSSSANYKTFRRQFFEMSKGRNNVD